MKMKKSYENGHYTEAIHGSEQLFYMFLANKLILNITEYSNNNIN